MNSCFVPFMCLVSYCFSCSFYYCFFSCICIICFDEFSFVRKNVFVIQLKLKIDGIRSFVLSASKLGHFR